MVATWAPLGRDLGSTEVTVSTGPGLGVLKPEEAGAAGADAELEAEGGGLLGLALLSLRLRSDQSGLGRWCRFWMGVFFFFSWNAR